MRKYIPDILIALQIIVYLIHVSLIPIVTGKDSVTYFYFDWSSLNAIFSSYRTIGYPLFLKAYSILSPSFHGIGVVQATVFSLSIVLLFHGLCRFGFSRWGAFCVILLFYAIPPRLHTKLLTESLAMSFSFASLAFLLFHLSAPEKKRFIAESVLCATISWLVRPSYQALILILPLLLLYLDRIRGESESLGTLLRRAGLYAAALYLPLFLICSLRYATVGDFSLLSFSGANLTALTSELLDPATIAELPPEMRMLAWAIHREHQNRGIPRSITYSTVNTEFPQNTATISRIGVSWGWRFTDGNWVRLNTRLAELFCATVLASPELYLHWYDAALCEAVSVCLITWISLPILLLILIMQVCIHIISRNRPKGTGAPDIFLPRQELYAVLGIFVIEFLIQVGMTVAIAPPARRYIIPTAAFLFPFLFLLIRYLALQLLSLCGYSISDQHETAKRPRLWEEADLIRLKKWGTYGAISLFLLVCAGAFYLWNAKKAAATHVWGGHIGLSSRTLKAGITPLHIAAMDGQLDEINALLAKGASVTAADHDCFTPLHWAVTGGSIACVKALLHADADISASSTGGLTPLHLAPSPSMVRCLLNAGAEIDAADHFGSTPLHLASSHDVREALLVAGANPNARFFWPNTREDFTPLHQALYWHDPAFLTQMLRHKADPMIPEKAGHTPVFFAKDVASLKLFKQAGASLRKTFFYRLPPTRVIPNELLIGDYARALIDTTPAFCNMIQGTEYTRFHWAAYRGQKDILQWMLHEGFTVHDRDPQGRTALHYAILGRDIETVKLLLQKNADLDAKDNNSETPRDWLGQIDNQAFVAAVMRMQVAKKK